MGEGIKKFPTYAVFEGGGAVGVTVLGPAGRAVEEEGAALAVAAGEGGGGGDGAAAVAAAVALRPGLGYQWGAWKNNGIL